MSDSHAQAAVVTDMRACVHLDNLRKAVRMVRPAVGRRAAANAALTGVRIDTDEERVHLTTTDLELSIQTWIPKVDATPLMPQAPVRAARRRGFGRRHRPAPDGVTGTAIVEFALLERFLKGRHPNDTVVSLTALADGTLRVQAGARSVTLPTIWTDRWPGTRRYGPPKLLISESDGVSFREWWGRLVPACADDAARPVLTGINVRRVDGGLMAAATDSYRAHMLKLTVPGERSVDVIFPPSALKVALQVSRSEQHPPLELWADEAAATVEFRGPHTVIRVRAIEGTFPPLTELIPDADALGGYRSVRIEDAEAAVAMLEDVARLVRPQTPVKLQFAGGSVTTWVKDEDVMRIDGDKLPGMTFETPQEPIAPRLFNPHYLAEIIRATGDGGTLLLRPGEQSRMVVFRNNEFTGILMPVRP